MRIRTTERYDENNKPKVCKESIVPIQTSDEMFEGFDDKELSDPGIEYDSVPVELHRIYHRCPKCDEGYMKFTGLVFATYPPQYEHRCDKCGYIDSYNRAYPGYIATIDE